MARLWRSCGSLEGAASICEQTAAQIGDDTTPDDPVETKFGLEVTADTYRKAAAHIRRLASYTRSNAQSGDARDAARWRQFLKMTDPDKVPGGFTVYYAIEEGTDQLCYADDDLNEIVDTALSTSRSNDKWTDEKP